LFEQANLIFNTELSGYAFFTDIFLVYIKWILRRTVQLWLLQFSRRLLIITGKCGRINFHEIGKRFNRNCQPDTGTDSSVAEQEPQKKHTVLVEPEP
jgi:hypothetical protein